MVGIRKFALAAATVALMAAGGAKAAPTVIAVDWVDWTAASGAGTAGGRVDGAVDGIGVQFQGNYSFAILSGDTDYWVDRNGDPIYTGPPATGDAITGDVVNRPTGTDLIGLSDAATNTIVFDHAVRNVYLAFTSWNGANVTFNHAFTLVSQGCGYWGCAPFTINGASDGFTGGGEVHGVLKFSGNISSLSMTDTSGEYWHGLTVGVGGPAPEPQAWALMLMGFGGIGAALRNRRRTAPALG